MGPGSNKLQVDFEIWGAKTLKELEIDQHDARLANSLEYQNTTTSMR